MPDLTGKTIVVTGANSGIGRETARSLVEHGAHVVLAVRDVEEGRDAAAAMTGSTDVRALDLADLASVHRFAESWAGGIHALINNAGLMIPPLGRIRDGFDLQFGINHLGHFALTNLLLPHITGRVVTVASGAHRSGTIDFTDLNWKRRPYGGGSAGTGSPSSPTCFSLWNCNVDSACGGRACSPWPPIRAWRRPIRDPTRAIP
jgi:NAD(P)-dependent dehydrogenase (short-subunit alcohol dehydrogenase family)